MFLHQEIVEQLRDGTWETDCVHMELVQNKVAIPARFIGQGYFRQEAKGTINYRLYPESVVGFRPNAGLHDTSVPGELIESHHYYRLDTQARDGIRWQAEWTIPQMDRAYLENGLHYLVGGEAPEVSFSRPFQNTMQGFYLTMVFFANATFPCNTPTETTHKIGGKQYQSSSKLNVARVSTTFGEFRISQKPGMVIVEVRAERPYPTHFETRIIEALGFVLATPLTWNAIFRIENGVETLRMRGTPLKVIARLERPVVGPHQTIDTTGDVWRLFERYLTLVCTHTDPSYHPCSRHLFAVLEASANSITTMGLALGVATEGIVKTLFPAAGTPMEGMAALMPRLRDYCVAWPEIPDGDLGDSVKRRLPGMIGQLTNVSTKDKFYAVAKEKGIYQEHIKAWGELRNRLAHGVTPDSPELQRIIDLCNKVRILMYHLIFRGCGYEGSYEDYSNRGYPRRYYRGRPATEEEKAVAAYYLSLNKMHQDDVARWYAGTRDLEEGIY